MELGLKGKVVLVTGAGSQIGFGKGICLAFAKEGCDVVASDIDLEGVKKTAAEVESLGQKALAIKADVTNEIEVNDMVKEAIARFGKIDILVNNAGTVFRSPFHLTTEKDWNINIGISLKGTWLCTRAVLGQMLERKSGKIINLSSTTGRTGNGTPLYAAAKAGIIGLTKGLANEVGPQGINVNGISPGMGDTGFQIAAKVPPEAKQRFTQMVPMRRMTTPRDIANMAVFLASDAASDIAGQTFNVDGGSNMI
jgi:NAD(P)-dependent dehydrogenase (short-subunit alcohol dehydrogenase family)